MIEKLNFFDLCESQTYEELGAAVKFMLATYAVKINEIVEAVNELKDGSQE